MTKTMWPAYYGYYGYGKLFLIIFYAVNCIVLTLFHRSKVNKHRTRNVGGVLQKKVTRMAYFIVAMQGMMAVVHLSSFLLFCQYESDDMYPYYHKYYTANAII